MNVINLRMRRQTMIKSRDLLPILVILAVVGCEGAFDVENPNAENLEELLQNPTRATVGAAATGLLISGRDEFDDRNGYVSLLGILGRESYNFDGSDPRFITEMLGGPLVPGSRAFGGNLWPERYANTKVAAFILGGLDVLDDAEVSPEEKEATRGFVKTMMAHELLIVINTRDVNGAIIEISLDPRAPPAPFVSKDATLAQIETLLDEARDHLDAAGSVAFPFALTSGFAGFDTPPTFRLFNRALAARVDVYTEDWMGAQTNLGQSFVNTAAPLDEGVYHAFSTASGDVLNELFDPGDAPDILAHPSIVADAESCDPSLSGCGDDPEDPFDDLDLRVQDKVRLLAAPRTSQNITTDVAFNIYRSNSDPMVIIRNEELILLRAEANFRLGMISVAADDINFLRVNSGGLTERMDLNMDNFEDELLLQRRYSLMFEGGHRWLDTRRMGRIEDLPLDLSAHVRNDRFPIPEEECLARGMEGSPNGGCV